MKTMSMRRASPDDLEAAYAEAAVRQGRASLEDDFRTANAQQKTIVAVRGELRSRGEEGQASLLRLLGHHEQDVRVWAASHVLSFAPAQAEEVLERACQASPSPSRLNAEMTLREWRAGRLPED
ncbi:MAG: DUF2019 domain-containing protein [Myxococcaceae bacterium]|nr:MAG: DUF2019 domain-containing protein [Myxococcaceae bacterium]